MNSLLNFLLRVLLSVGRSDDDRVSLLGDLEEERRARLARGSGRLAAFAWYAAEIVRALVWGLRDAFVRRAFALRRRTRPARIAAMVRCRCSPGPTSSSASGC